MANANMIISTLTFHWGTVNWNNTVIISLDGKTIIQQVTNHVNFILLQL